MRPWYLVFTLLVAFPPAARCQDADRDGIPDTLEQSLLEKFRPRFLISAHDCAAAPARFAPYEAVPRALATDGSIFGQAFPRTAAADRTYIELHYYHLWTKDCGRMSHALDAEHVAALVYAASLATPADAWKAVQWYSAAHEDTVCDAGARAGAATLGAEQNGPSVWIARGKHASYFTPECDGACGREQCRNSRELASLPIINLGELGAPLGGATWAASSLWPLAAKMTTDFPEALAELSPQQPITACRETHTPQRLVAAGNTTLDGVERGQTSTGNALDTGEAHTRHALQRAWHATRDWLRPQASKQP